MLFLKNYDFNLISQMDAETLRATYTEGEIRELYAADMITPETFREVFRLASIDYVRKMGTSSSLYSLTTPEQKVASRMGFYGFAATPEEFAGVFDDLTPAPYTLDDYAEAFQEVTEEEDEEDEESEELARLEALRAVFCLSSLPSYTVEELFELFDFYGLDLVSHFSTPTRFSDLAWALAQVAYSLRYHCQFRDLTALSEAAIAMEKAAEPYDLAEEDEDEEDVVF